MKKSQDRIATEGNTRQLLHEFDDMITVTNNVESAIKIELDNVKYEIVYLNSSVVCYMLGLIIHFL